MLNSGDTVRGIKYSNTLPEQQFVINTQLTPSNIPGTVTNDIIDGWGIDLYFGPYI